LASGRPFHAGDRSSILDLHPDREIEPINVERKIDILRVQMRTARIVKAPDFATGQN
jgi:hypothetical protein